MDKPLVEDWFQDINDGMMHHSIPKRGCTNFSWLRIRNLEMMIFTRFPGRRDELTMEGEQVIHGIKVKLCCRL
jgi:hypothetical protein